MFDRRDFMTLAGLGGGGLLLTAFSNRFASPQTNITLAGSDSPAANDLYDEIKSIPVDDTHCHPLTFNDAATTPDSFVERLSLSAFPLSRYFPEGIYAQWQSATAAAKRNLDKQYGISAKRNEVLFHTRETVFMKLLLKEMALFLDCEPSLESVIDERNRRGRDYPQYIRSLFKDANIANAMLDMGYRENLDEKGVNRFKKAIAPTKGRHILRVDTVLKDMMNSDVSFDEIESTMVADIENGLDGTGNLGAKSYGMKSYLLPRLGLLKPLYDRKAARESWDAFVSAREGGELPSMYSGDRDENWALRGDALRYLHSLALVMCLERDMPMQFHAGDGEPPRGIMRNQDPFLMEEMIRFDKDGVIRTPKIILIHAGYPMVGKAAWLSHLYTNCYFELSLATPLIHHGLLRMYMEVMEVVPLTKILFGSDAYHLPEFYWLAAKWGRLFLSEALGVYVEAKALSRDEAVAAAKSILHENNRRLYKIG